jgi:8-oxo-dGTP pyrophosphatase MutT (NUDIX family)
MRTSRASLAYICRRWNNQTQVLTQWSQSWRAFSLIGGHKLPRESYRDCLVREIAEELGLDAQRDYYAAARHVACLEFIAWSQSARLMTAYKLVIYSIGLLRSNVYTHVANDPNNRWLFRDEILEGATKDGCQISPTVNRVQIYLAYGLRFGHRSTQGPTRTSERNWPLNSRCV